MNVELLPDIQEQEIQGIFALLLESFHFVKCRRFFPAESHGGKDRDMIYAPIPILIGRQIIGMSLVFQRNSIRVFP